jgi:hypothetical protein
MMMANVYADQRQMTGEVRKKYIDVLVFLLNQEEKYGEKVNHDLFLALVNIFPKEGVTDSVNGKIHPAHFIKSLGEGAWSISYTTQEQCQKTMQKPLEWMKEVFPETFAKLNLRQPDDSTENKTVLKALHAAVLLRLPSEADKEAYESTVWRPINGSNEPRCPSEWVKAMFSFLFARQLIFGLSRHMRREAGKEGGSKNNDKHEKSDKLTGGGKRKHDTTNPDENSKGGKDRGSPHPTKNQQLAKPHCQSCGALAR